jgi:hypothetical protein
LLRNVGIGCLGVVLLLAVLLVATPAGRSIQAFWRNGAIQALVFEPPKEKYRATHESNLKALQTALMLYHDSEEKFPEAEGWMDAVEPRLQSNDLESGEGKKKLMRPDLNGKADAFGYAINAAAAGKYKDDIEGDEDPILVYESKRTERDAVGDPAQDRDGLAITLAGKIVE